MISKPFLKKLGIAAVVVIVALLSVRWALNELGLLRGAPWLVPGTDMPIVSTRGHFRNANLIRGHDDYGYRTFGDIPGMAPGTEVPDDLLIIIHGFNNDHEKAANACGLAQESLKLNSFSGVLVGYSWDADTQLDPMASIGFHEGRIHACGNGPKLARFILDYKAKCPNTRVHVMGYSMGTRVALETVLALYEDPAFADIRLKIDSVHLVGASVDNEEVQVNQKYGRAIENCTDVLINYYSAEDNILGVLYVLKEGDRALGETDIQNANMAPENYVSIDVHYELKMYDDEGNVIEGQSGDNHMGCLGNRAADGTLLDDGVMNLVADYINGLG